MAKTARDRVFLSYAREDLSTVRRIYAELKERQLNVWFDKEDLKPGEWMSQIEKAVPRSRFFVICISQAALKKTGDDEPGFIDKELNAAYKIADRQPDTKFTIVPVRLEDCGRGDFRITSFQQYDLFPDIEKGLDKLAVHLGGVSLSDATAHDERTEDKKVIDSLLGKAAPAFYTKDFEKALTIINSVLTLYPNNIEALTSEGTALSMLGRHEEALQTLDKAIELDPESSGAWTNKGSILLKLDRPEEALEALDKALELDPEFAVAWQNKGAALIRLDRHEEALQAYDEALELNPEFAGTWSSKGAALSRLDRFQEAL
jgi:tetratricopeptide (TPR) repeat protein